MASLIIGMVGIAFAGRFIEKHKPEGLIYTYQSADQDLRSMELYRANTYTQGPCPLSETYKSFSSECKSDPRGIPTALVIGDSRANAIFSGLVAAAERSQTWAVVSRPGCLPFKGVTVGTDKLDQDEKHCEQLAEGAVEDLSENLKIDLVIIAVSARIIERTISRRPEDYKSARTASLLAFKENIERLQKGGRRVVFLKDNPHFFDLSPCIRRFWPRVFKTESEICGISRDKHETQYADYYKFVEDLRAQVQNVTFIDPTDWLCDKDYCPISVNGKFLYSDEDHFSDLGSQLVAENLLRIVENNVTQ